MIQDISRAVAKARRVRWGAIMGKRRFREAAHARQEAMFIARELTAASLPAIGEYFRCHHTTVLHGTRAVAARMAESDEYRKSVTAMLDLMRDGPSPVFRTCRRAQ